MGLKALGHSSLPIRLGGVGGDAPPVSFFQQLVRVMVALSDVWGLSLYSFKHPWLYVMLPEGVLWKLVILSLEREVSSFQ